MGRIANVVVAAFCLAACMPMLAQVSSAPGASAIPAAKPGSQYQYYFDDIKIPRVVPEEPKIPFSERLAVDYMEQGALAWTKDRGCVACHTNGSYMVVRPMLTAQLGEPQTELRTFFVAQLHDFIEQGAGDKDATRVIYIAAGLAIWDANVDHHLSPETARALDLMFKLQQPDGAWFVDDDNNPPLESSPYQLTTVAARAVANAPGWLKSQEGQSQREKVARLENYLRAEGKMQGDYDRVDLLWAATEWPSLLTGKQKQELVQMIFSLQKVDGGWSLRTFARPEEWGKGNRADKLRQELNVMNPPSDGHMTGLAIIALRKAGVAISDPRIQAGVNWILANQGSSGRWFTRSLNRDGKQYITYSATAYSLLALALCDRLPALNHASQVQGE